MFQAHAFACYRQERLSIRILMDDIPDHRRLDDCLGRPDLRTYRPGKNRCGTRPTLLRIQVGILLICQQRGGVGDGLGRDVRVKVVGDDERATGPIWLRTRRTISSSACGMCSATMAPWRARYTPSNGPAAASFSSKFQPTARRRFPRRVRSELPRRRGWEQDRGLVFSHLREIRPPRCALRPGCDIRRSTRKSSMGVSTGLNEFDSCIRVATATVGIGVTVSRRRRWYALRP